MAKPMMSDKSDSKPYNALFMFIPVQDPRVLTTSSTGKVYAKMSLF